MSYSNCKCAKKNLPVDLNNDNLPKQNVFLLEVHESGFVWINVSLDFAILRMNTRYHN